MWAASELLVEMHEKLSQAVKLYDNLLTEQLSRPQWRAAGPSAVPQQQSPPAGYSTQYQSVNGAYNQWQQAPQQVPSTPAPAQSYFAPTPAPPVSQPAGAYMTSPASEHPPQQMYQPASAPILSPGSPVTQPRYGQEGPPFSALSPPPVSVPQYGAPPTSTPSTYQPVPQAPPAASAPPPPPSGPLHPQYATPQQQGQQPQQQQPALSRHNTVNGYRAPAPPAQQTSAPAVNGLARANTVSSHAPSQLQHLQQMSVPMPSFPQVPNTPPQPQAYYAAAPPEPERKEVLLIDL